MKPFKPILLIFSLLFTISANAQVKQDRRIEKNGFEWIELSQNYKFFGAINENGRIIIPLSRRYSFICFHDSENITGWFSVKRNGYDGACDINGKEIIAPNKYDNVWFVNEKNIIGWFGVERNGYQGACDINGNEIIAPNKYKKIDFINGKFYNVSNGLNKKVLIKTASSPTTKNLAYNKNTAQATTQASASRQTITSTNRRPAKKKPLMTGTYIQSGQGYCEETGQYTQGGSDWTCLVEFYDDHITVGGEYCELIKTFNNGTKHYSGNLGKYIVTKNYGMSLVSFGYGYTFRYAMRLKGQLTPGDSDNRDGDIPYQTPIYNSGNGSQNTYTTPRSSGSTRNTTRPRTAKRCGACDGKGWIPSTRGVASYGAKDKWCSDCNKKVPANHYHETCPSCKGKGAW